MSETFTTERPTPLALFGTDWTDRPPAPIENKWRAAHEKSKAARAEFADMFRARSRRHAPQIGAYALDDLDAAFARCRYPTHDEPFLFCGAVTDGESSWCACHAAIVFRG